MVRHDRSWSDAEGTAPKKGGGLVIHIKKGIKHSDTKFASLNVSSSNLESQWLEIDLLDFTTKSLSLMQLIFQPTRYYFKDNILKQSRVDLIFSNSECISSINVMNWNVTDHQAVSVSRKKKHTKTPKIDFIGRSYKNYVKEDFQDSLLGMDWTECYNARNPDEMWEMMKGFILEVADEMCPLRPYKVKGYSEPWITNEAIEAIKDKDRLLRLAKTSGNKQDWDEAKRVRNKVSKDLRNLRADFLKQ